MARPAAKKSALSGSVIAPQAQPEAQPQEEPTAVQPAPPAAAKAVVKKTPAKPDAKPTWTKPSDVDDAPKSAEKAQPDPGGLRSFDKGFEGKGRRKSAADRSREKGKVPLGLYFPEASDLDEARRAFVTDFWEHDGPDTFVGWVGQAIREHAARTHSERAQLTQERRETRSGVRGIVRKLDVAPALLETVEQGIAEDRKELRRQITTAAWCHDAVMAAIAATKARTTGELMEIDGRLPPRLRK